MNRVIQSVCAVVLVASGVVQAEVTIETVPVGNTGNTGEVSGSGAGGYGPDRICGAVDYEYNIGKYEVTAGQYSDFLNAIAKTDTYGLYNTIMSLPAGCRILRSGDAGSYTYSVAADYANRPVNYVSWADTVRFANWLHNGQPTGAQDLNTTEDGAYRVNGATHDSGLLAITRKTGWKWAITSEDEWYKAAYYNPGMDDYYGYPTSSNSVPGYIDNNGDFSRAGDGNFVEGGTDPGNYATYDHDDGPWQDDGIGSPYWRTEVGEHENSGSPYGTFDQGGNVWEWTESILNNGASRGLRGGSFSYIEDCLHAPGRGTWADPPHEYYFVGFRVTQVPEPATMTLLYLGGLVLLKHRRNKGHKSQGGGREL